MNILWFLIIGVAAGWIASQFVKGGDKGILGDLVVGAIGGVIGGHVFVSFDVAPASGLLGALLTSVVGAVILLSVVRILKR